MRIAIRISLVGVFASVGCSTLIGLEDWTPMPESTSGTGGSALSDGGSTGGSALDGSQLPADAADGSIGSGGAPADGGADAPIEAGPPPKLACAAKQITSSGKNLATASTSGGTDNYKLSCAQGNAPDVAFDWIVPATDYYSVNTAGSSFDTVLGLLQPICGGAADGGLDAGVDGGAPKEIACNNNAPATSQSEIVKKLQKGDRVLAVVDGWVGASGNVVFNAEPIACPGVDLSDQTLPATFTNVDGLAEDGSLDNGATCGGTGKPQKAYRWTPKTAGLYRFTVTSSAFSPVLYLEDGAKCGSPLLQCSQGELNGYPAEVTRWVAAGQPMTLLVDTLDTTGDFALDVQPVTGQSCPSQASEPDPANPNVVPAGHLHDISGSCGLSGSKGWMTAGAYPTVSYPVKVNIGSGVSCSMSLTSPTGAFNAYLLRGKKCDGAEVHCDNAVLNGASWHLQWGFGELDSGDYVLIIQNLDTSKSINVNFMMACLA